MFVIWLTLRDFRVYRGYHYHNIDTWIFILIIKNAKTHVIHIMYILYSVYYSVYLLLFLSLRMYTLTSYERSNTWQHTIDQVLPVTWPSFCLDHYLFSFQTSSRYSFYRIWAVLVNTNFNCCVFEVRCYIISWLLFSPLI